MHCRRECKKATTELFLEQGVVPRSSDAMVAWRSLIDVHCVCNQMPRMMSRPTPKSGGRRRRLTDLFTRTTSVPRGVRVPVLSARYRRSHRQA